MGLSFLVAGFVGSTIELSQGLGNIFIIKEESLMRNRFLNRIWIEIRGVKSIGLLKKHNTHCSV